MPKAMISFSRLRGGGNSNGNQAKASRIQGSFAESISIEEDVNTSTLVASEDCDDTSSCSSSSEEEESPHIHSSQQGSFPSCPPSVEQNKLLGVVSMPLPVVFEEEESDISVSNMDEEEDGKERDLEEKEKATQESTRTVDVDSQKYNPEAHTKDTIESGFCSSSKTVCSNMDATCQTAPISVSQDSASEVSTELNSSKNLDDELDSRLNAILALKEVVFTQRMAIKETTKDKKRLIFKITQRDRINRKLLQRNKELERELDRVKELLQDANSKLAQKGTEEHQNDVVDSGDDVTVDQRKEETIFELLHRMNEKRKNKKSSKALRSNPLFCQ